MGRFDSFDYDIKSRLPEWWKGFGALEPINEYTQTLIAEILQGLLTSMGVVQPLNCWKTIPEEYNWYHHYTSTDDYLYDETEEGFVQKAVSTMFPSNTMHAKLPNTKRNCHARIQLKLLGTEIPENTEKPFVGKNEIIDELTIRNAEQEIILKNISSVSTIEILTETNEILIDGEERYDLIEGSFHKIKPTILHKDFLTEEGIPIDLKDENKKTEITFDTTKTVNFDLQIYLLKPTYTTEQNIRIATVSAFPIEWVKLWGYFCHPFNNKSGYEKIKEKKYSKESRTVYDRITTQYDCERFYIQVKFYGIGVPLIKGFPQEAHSSNPAFQPNPQLDKWGKIYNLPRRSYKPDITEDEEPFTLPKYYNYPIEQDYWYEERMVNEYQYDSESINSAFIKDDEYNNIGMLECIYPTTDDIWVYTETIDPNEDITHEIKDVPLHNITQDIESPGVKWENPEQIQAHPIYTTLSPKNIETKDDSTFPYRTKKLLCSFCLKSKINEIPKNITIKGIELKFKTHTNLQSKTIKISETSTITIPYLKPFSPYEKEWVKEKKEVVSPNEIWLKDKGYYTIGGEHNLFGEKEITREQLFEGNEGKIDFELVFENENNFLESILYLENISLNIYYEIIPNEYDVSVEMEKHQIILEENENELEMKINVENRGKIEIHDKEIFIVIPPELEIKHAGVSPTPEEHLSFFIDLDIDEKFTIDNIIISPKSDEEPRTGWYDILIFCENKVISKEILIRGRK